jgi:hypothetical protein
MPIEEGRATIEPEAVDPPASAPKRRLSPVVMWVLCTLVALALVGLVYALAYRPGDPPIDAAGTPEPPGQTTNP